jgi:hypothetical protein
MVVLSVMLWGLTIDSEIRLRANVTTIERMDGERMFAPGRYDLGTEENLRQVLGDGWFRRWWPRPSTLTGFEWAAIGFDRFLVPPEMTFMAAEL